MGKKEVSGERLVGARGVQRVSGVVCVVCSGLALWHAASDDGRWRGRHGAAAVDGAWWKEVGRRGEGEGGQAARWRQQWLVGSGWPVVGVRVSAWKVDVVGRGACGGVRSWRG